jgi:hypothetical protein
MTPHVAVRQSIGSRVASKQHLLNTWQEATFASQSIKRTIRKELHVCVMWTHSHKYRTFGTPAAPCVWRMHRTCISVDVMYIKNMFVTIFQADLVIRVPLTNLDYGREQT